MKFTRSPIICLLAHVDHGKTTLLDNLRGTKVAQKEAGGITQMIGASYISKKEIDAISKEIAKKMNIEISIPGLLFIDTPGHEAFDNLRDRGGSLADLVILLVDITEGFKPQTIESIEILKQHKTPFIIAANKVDKISGWKNYPTLSFLESLAKQPEHIRQMVDEKIYTLMGEISEHGFDSERFDRINDFAKQIAIIPISARTREGLSELLVLIGGLSQRFLGDNLEIDANGRGKASVIEVKEEKGLGTTVDVIVYDGIMRKNDEIAYMTRDGIKRTKIRGLLEPSLKGKEKFVYLNEVVAASGVKILAPDVEDAIPGSPLEVIRDFEKERGAIEAQYKSVIFSKGNEAGVIVRADSLGAVEALLKVMEKNNIKVKGASVGNITRKEILSAGIVAEADRYLGVVVGFNVSVQDEAWEESRDSKIPIICSNIIYRIVEDYQEWVKNEKERVKKEALVKLTWPGKIKVLDGYVFRASKPAVFGIDVLEGKIRKNYRLMDTRGEIVGKIKEIQKEKEKVDEALAKEQLAISCEGITIGKNVNEKDTLYTYMTVDELKEWEEKLDMFDESEKELFNEIRSILRKYF